MRVEESYDLIVIGDQLSGLFLAAGAASQGQRVLVLEESNFPTVLYEVPSGRLLGDFMAAPVIGLREGSPVDAFLRGLGLYQELSQLFPRHDPPLQLVSEGFRLDLGYGSPNFGRDLSREVVLPPETGAGFRRLLTGELPSRRSFADEVAALGLPVAFERLGSVQATLYGALLPATLPYADFQELYRLCAEGVRYPSGGRGALKEHLLARIQILGGSLRRNSRVEEIVFERGRLAGVLLSSYEGFVRAERVVGAMAARTFFELIPPEQRPRRLGEAVGQLRPRAWKLGFTLLVPEAVLPEGMGSHVALFDPDGGVEGDALVQLQIFPKDSYGGIPSRSRAILGRILMPFEESSLQPRAIATALRRALARVETVIPFLREQPFSMFPDPANLESDPVFQRYCRFSDLSYIPASLLLYERGLAAGSEANDYLDWGHFGLPGLALCSRDIHPMHGLLGEIKAAMELLERWRKARPKAPPPAERRAPFGEARP